MLGGLWLAPSMLFPVLNYQESSIIKMMSSWRYLSKEYCSHVAVFRTSRSDARVGCTYWVFTTLVAKLEVGKASAFRAYSSRMFGGDWVSGLCWSALPGLLFSSTDLNRLVHCQGSTCVYKDLCWTMLLFCFLKIKTEFGAEWIRKLTLWFKKQSLRLASQWSLLEKADLPLTVAKADVAAKYSWTFDSPGQ